MAKINSEIKSKMQKQGKKYGITEFFINFNKYFIVEPH